MSITSAMFTGVSGLLANAEGINVIGNNLANVNTVGFKSSRTLFSDMLSANIGNGSQVGRGTQIQKVDNLFTQGSFETSENVTDLALQGNSFFALKDPNATSPVTQNNAFLTRAGAFRVDSSLTLVSPDGYQVLDTQGNPIKFSDNAAGVAAAITALTTQMTALQGKTTALDTNAAALVTAANTDLTTATTNFGTQLAPLSVKATAIDNSATGLVTAANTAVTSAQADLKTALAPLQAKATVLDTKGQALQLAAGTAVTNATKSLYDAAGPTGSLYDLQQLLNGGVGAFSGDIGTLVTNTTVANGASAAEIASATSIDTALTTANLALTTVTGAVTPANIAAAQQAVSNLTTLITNSSGIFVDHTGTGGLNLLANYSAIIPAPVAAAATTVTTDTATLNTALTAQTTADGIKTATAAALAQVNTAYNAAAPTSTQANDALLALNNVSGTISSSSGVFVGVANAEYNVLNNSLTNAPALAGLTATANTAVTALQTVETQQTAANAIKTATGAAVTAANAATTTPSVANATSALASLNSAGTAITSGAATFTTPSINAAFGLLNSSLSNGPTLASLTTAVNSATTAVTNAQTAQTAATALKTSTAAALAAANTATTSQNGTDIANALTALGASSTLIASGVGSFTAANALTAFSTLNTSLGSAPGVAALTTSVNTASTALATQQNSAFSKIVKVESGGLITFLGKDGGTYYYNASGQQGVAAILANAGTVSKIAVISPKDASALDKAGNSLYKQTAASGVPATAFSLTDNSANGTSEKIYSNSLEQSNVDMAGQFVKMILTQRAYSANSKTITTADEMTQEALNLKR